MEKKYKLLIVDDTELNRSLLTDMLSAEYEILEAENGMKAVALLDKYHTELSVVLLDIVMPVMDGFEVLNIMNTSGWIKDTPVITISSETSPDSINKAYDMGAADYINRPFDENTVRHRVKNTIMLYSKQKMLENMVTEQIIEKERNNYLMVEILGNIVEFRNGESGQHVLNIRNITGLLMRQLVRTSDTYRIFSAKIALIVHASSLHDIGKISIPEKILNKPGKLTAGEFEIMKMHSVIGAQILEKMPCRQEEELVQVAHDICRWHHERYDGKGYPDGLKGNEIPIAAQVVALADVYDALTHVRVYKSAYSHDEAIRIILNGECGAFSPELLKCLVEVGPHIREAVKEGVQNENSDLRREIWRNSDRLLSGGQVSNRTVALLEQERIKYQFFASMSKEIQFEYNIRTDILSLSEWGAKYLGLSERIIHPMENAELHRIMSREDYIDLRKRLRKATPLDPVINRTYLLRINGIPRWYKVVARSLWVGEGRPEMTGSIGKFSDVHEEYIELKSLIKMAGQDSLTKLHNHMMARKKIETALKQKDRCKYAMILCDLDDFKLSNDRYGHLFGDEVLKHVAGMLLKSIRSNDIAARIGGDEFMIFISYQDSVEPVVRRILNSVTGSYRGFPISISMGIALFPESGKEYDTLFHCADQALYAAKNNGKHRYCVYNESLKGSLSVLSPMDREFDHDTSE